MSDLIGYGKPGACRAAAPEKPRQEARGAQHFRGQQSRASQTAVWKDKDQNSALEVKLVFIPSVAFNFLLPISFHKWHNPFSSLLCDAADFQPKVRRQIKSDSQHCLMTLWVLSLIPKHTVKFSKII